MPSDFVRFLRESREGPAVSGYLHSPAADAADGPTAGLVLTHGAGSNCDAPLLVALAEGFAAAGVVVLRCDLPYRQARPQGPPHGGAAKRDREGLRRAVAALREEVAASRRDAGVPVYLGGQSYGGRQATMAAADDTSVTDGLLLISYPLHPPGKPERLRTEHFPRLESPAFFAQGTKDPFGSVEEMREAVSLIPAQTELFVMEGGGHGLITRRSDDEVIRDVATRVRETFLGLVR